MLHPYLCPAVKVVILLIDWLPFDCEFSRIWPSLLHIGISASRYEHIR